MWRKGVQLADTALWCDARRAQAICFLSHASVGRQPAHQQLIATPTTLALLGGAEVLGDGHLAVPYRKRFTLGTLQLELVPNGHGFGTAALYATAPTRRALYLGRPRATPNWWGEEAEIRPVDALCLDVGEGLAEVASPPIGACLANLAQAIADSAAHEVVVVCATLLIAYEVANGLSALGMTVVMPKALRRSGLTLATPGTVTGAQPQVAMALASRAQAHDKRPRFHVGPGTGHGAAPWRWTEALTRDELVAMVERARPRELYLTGAGAMAAHATVGLLGARSSTVLAPPWQMSLRL
ncbi:MAG: hypothetical protein IPL79_19475 [Myxococcales bacterium]|nr:hypothetical protein [Myxococcales bacterium]